MSPAMNTVLRASAVLAVLMLTTLGVLFVFDVIPPEMLRHYTIKTLVLAGIVAAAGLILGVLLKNGKPD